MNDDLVRLSVVGQILRRRWPQLVAAAAAGALLGAGAPLLLSPGYETSSRVLLQGPRSNDQLLTETQIATSSGVLDRTAAALGWGLSGPDLRDSVNVQLVDGNVIEIQGTAASPARAQELTDHLVEEYVRYSTQLVSSPTNASAQLLQEQREALRQQVAKTNERITELHGSVQRGGPTVDSVRASTQLEALRSALTGAVRRLDEAEETSSRANLVVLEPASLPGNRAEPTIATSAPVGALLAFLIAVFGHLVAARADRRLRSDSDIASALGSDVLSTVDVPNPPARAGNGTTPAPARFHRRLLRLLTGAQPWYAPQVPVPDDEFTRNVRYRRILARLRGAPEDPLRLLVVVAADDPVACLAAAQFAVATGLDGEPTSVVTDRAELAQLVQHTANASRAENPRLTILPSPDVVSPTARTVIRVAQVSPDRPTVPDDRRASGAIVVTTAGARTGWELVCIAAACADAGLSVLGTVIAYRARATENDSPVDQHDNAGTKDPARPDRPEISRNGTAMAGKA